MNKSDKNNVVSFKEKRKQYKKKKKTRKGASRQGQEIDWKVYLQVLVFLAFLALAMQQC